MTKQDNTLFIFGWILIVVGVILTLFSFWQQQLSLGNFWHWNNILFPLRSTGIFTFCMGLFSFIINHKIEMDEKIK